MISTYKELCKTVGHMLDDNNLDWPLYNGDGRLGEDSTGGTEGTLYGAMCNSGFLTIDSQDGFCDDSEEQKAYVCFYCPRKTLIKLRKALIQNKVLIDIFDEDEETIHSFVTSRFTDKKKKIQNRLQTTSFLKQNSKPELEAICSWDKADTVNLQRDIGKYDLVNCIAITLIPCSQQLYKLEDQMYRLNVFA